MARYTPWYERASCLQLAIYGALAVIVLHLVIEADKAPIWIEILLDPNEWRGVRPYGVIGEIFGSALVGAIVGVWAYRRLKRKKLITGN
jgi:hypothetical protein